MTQVNENTHNENELLRLENQAGAIDAELDGAENLGNEATSEAETRPPFNAELADVLDMIALAGSAILVTVPDHFNHDQNIRIADGMILLADMYGYDLRKNFLSGDSVVMLWLGLAITVGVPAKLCMNDWQRLKEKEVKEATEPDAEKNNAQNGENVVS